MLTIFCFLVKRMHVFKNCKMKGINCRSITIFQRPFIQHVNLENMPAYFGFKKIAISILFISFFITNPFWGICQSGNNLDSLLNQLQNTTILMRESYCWIPLPISQVQQIMILLFTYVTKDWIFHKKPATIRLLQYALHVWLMRTSKKLITKILQFILYQFLKNTLKVKIGTSLNIQGT